MQRKQDPCAEALTIIIERCVKRWLQMQKRGTQAVLDGCLHQGLGLHAVVWGRGLSGICTSIRSQDLLLR